MPTDPLHGLVQWHEILGAVLEDFFAGTPYAVETEVDLSRKKQLVDIVVIRKGLGECELDLPDGLGPLAIHNLISFKSHQDVFDWWTVLELIGHYVNYRKQNAISKNELLPESAFRLIGISARFPEGLTAKIDFVEVGPGVYDIQCGKTIVRLLVIRNLPNALPNAMLKLFSTVPEQIEFACEHYHTRSPQTSGIVEDLVRKYRKEGFAMAATFMDLARRIAKNLPPEELLRDLPPSERMKGIPAEERIKGIPAEERIKDLSPAEIEKLRKLLNEAKE